MGSEPTHDATNTTARAKQVQKTPLAPPSEKNLRGRAGDWRRERKKNKKKKVMHVKPTALQRLHLGSLRRFCCLLPLFEDSGYISLMICANGFPISSFVFKLHFSFSSQSACTLSVSR